MKISYEATSDQACVVDVLGEFAPGETKQITDEEVALFKVIHGHDLAASHFAPWFHLTVIITEAEEA